MKLYTVRQGRRYRARIELGLFEQVASNDMIAERLREAGFAEVNVTGDGRTREAEALWPVADTARKSPRRSPRSRRSRFKAQAASTPSGATFSSEPSAPSTLHARALRQVRAFDPPDRVADLDAAAAVDDRVDEAEALADMLHGALVEERPVALERVLAEIFQRGADGSERQQAEPDELPLPGNVEGEGDERGDRRGKPEPHEEDARQT